MTRDHAHYPVLDPAGNTVPNVMVRLVDPDTNASWQGVSIYRYETGVEEWENPFLCETGVIDFYLENPKRLHIGVTPDSGGTETMIYNVDVGVTDPDFIELASQTETHAAAAESNAISTASGSTVGAAGATSAAASASLAQLALNDVSAMFDQIVNTVQMWQPNVAVLAGAVRQAPDGSRIKATIDRTTRPTFDTTEKGYWTAVFATSGTFEAGALSASYVRFLDQNGDPLPAGSITTITVNTVTGEIDDITFTEA